MTTRDDEIKKQSEEYGANNRHVSTSQHFADGARWAFAKADEENLKLKEEIKALKDLAWDLDDYVIHSRYKCDEPFIKCTCGLSKIKERLPEFSKEEIGGSGHE